MTHFIRVVDSPVDLKANALRDAARRETADCFSVPYNDFRRIPGTPFSYWVSDRLRQIFASTPKLQSNDRTAVVGIQTSDDTRFLRTWWECDRSRFRPIAKGGPKSAYYADIPMQILWHEDGRELKASVEERYGTASKHVQNQQYYFRPGITWPLRGSRFTAQAVPSGGIFSVAGKMAFAPLADLPALLALVNSSVFSYFIRVQSGAVRVQFEAGLLQRTPVPSIAPSVRDRLASLSRRAWSLKRTLDTVTERSHAFVLPQAIYESVGHVDFSRIARELDETQQAIDQIVFDLYGVSADDRSEIERAALPPADLRDAEEEVADDAADDEPGVAASDAVNSWLVGVAFGRFDIRLATRERPIPVEPEPFDPLPAQSPGMWPVDEPRTLLPPTILVDDEGHNHDLRSHVASVMARTGWPDPLNLREWLVREFFPLHIRMYSKSRRKAPIYWQLATPSASYSVWLYVHAFTRDTLFQVQNDYVAPKLRLEERKLAALTQSAGASPTASQRKEIAAHEAFVIELRAMLDEVRRVAPLWNPDLDDGVIINFAPLYRLVPHHKPWQKELKSTWDALCSGEFDWAHLAMHLWPERVVPKCALDRSLAIAHGLDDIFWAEDAAGKWKPRPKPTRPIAEIVAERTSPAVRAALDSLLAAPSATSAPARRAATRRAAGTKRASPATEDDR